MKSLKSKILGLFIGLLVLTMSGMAFAAVGTTTQKMDKFFIGGVPVKKVVTISWVAGTGGGADDGDMVPATINAATYELAGYYLYSIETNPGDTAPTDNYDLTVTDADGLDVLWAKGYNRDEADTEIAFLADATYGYYVVRGNLTVTMVNGSNTVAASSGDIILTFVAQ